MLNQSSVYSVDMIRLFLMVEIEQLESFDSEYLMNNSFVKYFISRKTKNYRHNFDINESYKFGNVQCKNSFWMGFQHNNEKVKNAKATLVVEYNPNNCDETQGLLGIILRQFFYNPQAIYLKSCDVCRDFEGIDMDAVVYEKNRKNTEISYQTAQGRTIYLGKRGSNGHIKIYDKAAELKLTDEVRTRWEATLKFKDFTMDDFLLNIVSAKDLNVNLPTVHLGDNGFTGGEDMMMKCAVNAIKNGSAKLADFTPYKQKQIKPYLEKGALFTINNEDIPKIIQSVRDYLKDYLTKMQQRKTG